MYDVKVNLKWSDPESMNSQTAYLSIILLKLFLEWFQVLSYFKIKI